MEHLFSYGTLQLEKVQLESFGRTLIGKSDRLFGYKLDRLEITDYEVLTKSGERFHPIALKTGKAADFIQGVIYEITYDELVMADTYEVSDYTRIREVFESGISAWIYVSAKQD